MPERNFLTEPEPLVHKAASWLAQQPEARGRRSEPKANLSSTRPVDLSRFIVVLPTSGAARRLRAELARAAADAGTGVLPPQLTTPMGLLSLNTQESTASRCDCLLAWASVISGTAPKKSPLLLAGFSDLKRSALRIGQSLMEVCSLLAEAGLTPSSPEILRACPQDEDRWREIEALYRRYRECLEKAGLSDPNVSHLRAVTQASSPPGIERIIVAGVPDLSPLVERYLGAVAVPVTILIDAPECGDAPFDGWGRPDEKFWSEKNLALPEILTLADPPSEAEAVARLLGPAALCVADSALLPHHQRALEAHGREAFDPAGQPLARLECAAIARLWIAFCRTRRLAVLRALAEHPVFLQAFCPASGLNPRGVLTALDQLTTKSLVVFLPDALKALSKDGAGLESKLITTAEKWRAAFDTAKSLEKLPAFLEKIYAGADVVNSSALASLGEILRGLLESPLHEGETDEELFAAETQSTVVYGLHDENAVELNGWLEAPWLPHEALVLSGCTEGALPANVIGHPFLPDSLRVALGLAGNARRFSRDVYLLHCLLACREPAKVKITLSRTGAEGEPARPSRLLFRCAEENLPARVRELFAPAPTLRVAHARENAWLLEVPPIDPPTKLRATSFGDYLDCPLRFYFKRMLKMETVDAQKSEMDALDFGSALHLALEDFSRNTALRDSRDAEEIARHVHAALDRVLHDLFGAKWSLPVRVQRESLRARLRKFAQLQAAERAAGWRIIDAEVPFVSGETLTLGGLEVTGQIDRVEIHEQTGQRRILDYKTYKSVKKHLPSETHYAKSGGECELPEAEFELEDKQRRWRQLQLPLYRALAQHRWPDDPVPALAGYFLLPEKIEESGIFEFAMDDFLFDSAMQCAAAVADRVRRGVFWPPREPQYENFDEIFLGQDPATLLTPGAITFLKGN